ncbi:transmembrane protease serine 11D-like [Lemur catta]|uniref:transmembrane protease serine 11D-like n=1 Tax=Lemur catta TaxID=9447 RepID=UPI001E26E098|nr:transmembrane protease serine 11D-like [Lemur catta]
MYRPAGGPSTSRFLNPWVVFFIVIAAVAILAVTIALLVYFLAFGQKSYFYRSSFQILNVEYNDQLDSPGTQENRALCERIESLITKTFKESSLRNQFIKAHVVKLRQGDGGVIADTVMKFRFPRNNNGAIMKNRIKSILGQMLNNSGNLEINPPTEITCKYFHCPRLEKRGNCPVTMWGSQNSNLNLSCSKNEEGSPATTLQHINAFFSLVCGARPDLISLSEERVTGSTQAQEGDWPWQVSLRVNNGHHCGGVLISNTWILTAAHCFRSYSDPRQWTATFGIYTASPLLRKTVRRIIIHNNYTPITHENDIAAVQLDSSVDFTRNIHTVCLPEATQNILPGSTAYVTGWGALEYGGNTVTDLRQGQVRIISNDVCNAPASYNGAILSGMLCAGTLQGNMVDACQGDSGGPLVQEDSRQLWFLVGIVSWGDQCGLPDKPGVYTRVTAYRDWIAQQTGV